MRYRPLGRTGLELPHLSFGAGDCGGPAGCEPVGTPAAPQRWATGRGGWARHQSHAEENTSRDPAAGYPASGYAAARDPAARDPATRDPAPAWSPPGAWASSGTSWAPSATSRAPPGA